MTAGSVVRGNVTSSTSSISILSFAHVYGDAKAGSAITVGGAGQIDGTRTKNVTSVLPTQTFPSFTFVSADWTAAGYTIRSTCSNCSTAVSDINNWFGAASGSYVVRVTPACAMTFTDNTTYTVKGNLAVITDGGITFGTNAKLVPAAGTGPWNVYLFAGMANTAPCDLTTSTNSGVASGLNALFFANTNCAVTMNSNVSLAAGQIFAGTVNWNNNVSFGYKQVPVPGGAANAASQDVKCIREVVTGPPPTTAPNC